MPVTFVSVLVVELVSAWIGGGDTFATHDVAGSCAFVEISVGLLGVERQTARFGAGDLRRLEHLVKLLPRRWNDTAVSICSFVWLRCRDVPSGDDAFETEGCARR